MVASSAGSSPRASLAATEALMRRSVHASAASLPTSCVSAGSSLPPAYRTSSRNSTMDDRYRSGPERSSESSAVACFHPSPSVPSREVAGRRTSSKNTSLNSCAPVRSMIGFTVTPGVSIGMTNCDRPACRSLPASLLTSAIMKWLTCAPVVQTFWPLMTHSSPSRRADVRTEARSDPEPGSLRPMQAKASPRAIAGTQRCFSSSLPSRSSSGALCRSAIQCAPTGAPAASSSSITTYRSSWLRS